MKAKILIPLLACLAWCHAFTPAQAQAAPPKTLPTMTLHVGKATLATEIASTPAQQEQGLMFRSKLGDNNGMIFILPGTAPATFWMKNTLIPLSIAFIDKNGVIMDIHDMKPLDETITRSDGDHVAYALEANLHWFSLNDIKPGDKISPLPSATAQ